MASKLAESVTDASEQDKYQRRVGSGLTPQLITSVLRSADLGYMDQWADLLDEVRQADPHLHSELFKRERRVAGAKYEIRPNGKSAKAKKAAEYCQEVVDALEIPMGSGALSFRGMLQQLLSGNYHGRAACETIWRREGRYLRPVRVEWIHARRLAYAARNWKLHLWDATSSGTQFNAFPGVALDDESVFPRGKLIVHTPRIYGTYPTREGMGRCLVWFAAFKRWDIRDWLAFAEWAGRGLKVGKYRTGRDPKNEGQANEEDQQVLKDVMNAWSSTVGALIPDVTDLEVHGPPVNGEVHERLCQLCNNEISKGVLGGTLSADPGDRGARSLGEVQERGQIMIGVSDAEGVSDTVRRDFFAPAVEERFDDSYPVPFLALLIEPPESLDAFAKRVDVLANRGLQIPAAFVRDTMGWPDPKDGEETIGAKAPDPAAAPGDEAPAAEPPKN
jgi:phage gp29-like protein